MVQLQIIWQKLVKKIIAIGKFNINLIKLIYFYHFFNFYLFIYIFINNISAKNPYSQFRDVYSFEQIKSSPQIFGPLTKLQCCPTSDGSAAVIVASEKF